MLVRALIWEACLLRASAFMENVLFGDGDEGVGALGAPEQGLPDLMGFQALLFAFCSGKSSQLQA